jgi:hypothetical protein
MIELDPKPKKKRTWIICSECGELAPDCCCAQKPFSFGDRVSWCYIHSLNHLSKTTIRKIGTFYGCINHTCRYNGPDLALVQFDGNKQASRVPVDELVKVEKEKKRWRGNE